MMEMTNVWQQFEALSPEAKRQVAEFIAFLGVQRKRRSVSDVAVQKPLTKEAFVGIWSDREELADSSEWVRRLRTEKTDSRG
jgi:hypothetical protein